MSEAYTPTRSQKPCIAFELTLLLTRGSSLGGLRTEIIAFSGTTPPSPLPRQLVVFYLPFSGTHSSMILFSTHLFTCLPSPLACICLTGITTCQLPAQCQHVLGPWWMLTVRAARSAARPSGWVCGLPPPSDSSVLALVLWFQGVASSG